MYRIASRWRSAGLDDANETLCRYADKLTRHPHEVTDADIEDLRLAGFTDAAIHDATQVIGYFNYINRMADGLGVAEETFVHAWEQGVPKRK